MNGWSWRGWRQRCVGGVARPIEVSVKVYECKGEMAVVVLRCRHSRFSVRMCQ